MKCVTEGYEIQKNMLERIWNRSQSLYMYSTKISTYAPRRYLHSNQVVMPSETRDNGKTGLKYDKDKQTYYHYVTM